MPPSPNTYPATSLEVDGYIATTLCPPGVTTFSARPDAYRDATAALVTAHRGSSRRSTGVRTTNGTSRVTTPGNRVEVRIMRSIREMTTGGAAKGGPVGVPPLRFVSTRARPPRSGPRNHDGALRPRARAAKGSPGARTSPARPYARPRRRPPRGGDRLGVPASGPITRRLCSGTGRSPRRAALKRNGDAYGTRGLRACGYRTSVIRHGRSPGRPISSWREGGEGAMSLWKPSPVGSMAAERAPTATTSVKTPSGTGSSRMPGSDRPGSTSCAAREVAAPRSFRVPVRALTDRRKVATGSGGFSPRGPVGAPRAPPTGWSAPADRWRRLLSAGGHVVDRSDDEPAHEGCHRGPSMASGVSCDTNETLIRSFRHCSPKRSMLARGDETAPTQCA